MNKLFLAFGLILANFLSPNLAYANAKNPPKKNQENKQDLVVRGIKLGEIFKQDEFKYKLIDKIPGDDKISFDLLIFEINKGITADNKLFLAVDRKSRMMLFCFFHPIGTNKEIIMLKFGEPTAIKPNGSWVYEYEESGIGILVEFDKDDNVILIGRSLLLKDA